MNEELLNEKREFFSGCKMIVEAPGSFFWTGEHSVMYGWPALLQPISLTATVGIVPLDKSKKNFEFDFLFVKNSAPTYRDDLGIKSYFRPTSSMMRETIKKLTDVLINWREFRKHPNYYRFNIWSDIPTRAGLNSSGAISICFAIILYAIEKGYLDKENVYKDLINNLAFDDLRRESVEKSFWNIFYLGWLFDDIFHNYSSSGAGPLSSFLATSEKAGELILYCTERKGFGSKHAINRETLEFGKHIDALRSISIYTRRIKIPDSFKKNFEVSTIYSGFSKGTEIVLGCLEEWHSMPLDELCSLLKLEDLFNHKDTGKSMSSLWTWNDISAISKFTLESELNGFPRAAYSTCIGMISLRILTSLMSSDHTSFRDLIKENNRILEVYGVYPKVLSELENWLYKSAIKIKGEEDFSKHKARTPALQPAAKLTGAGGGGSVLIFGNNNTIEYINNIFKKRISIEEYLDYQLHYSSLENGWVGKSTRLIPKSDVIRQTYKGGKPVKKSIIYPTITSGKKGSLKEKDYRKIVKNPNKKIAVLIDYRSNDIWIFGEKTEVGQTPKKILEFFGNFKPPVSITFEEIYLGVWDRELPDKDDMNSQRVDERKAGIKNIQTQIQNSIHVLGPEGNKLKKYIIADPGRGYKIEKGTIIKVIFVN